MKMINKNIAANIMAITALSVAIQSVALPNTAPTLKDGFYVGIAGGVSHNKTTLDNSHRYLSKPYNAHFSNGINMPSLGFIGGYGHRYYDNYLGVEIQGHDYINDKDQQSIEFPGAFKHSITSNFKLNQSLSLLLVYGHYLSKSVLFIVHAGITTAKINNTTVFTVYSSRGNKQSRTFYNQSDWLKGLKLGAGLQLALTSHVSGRVMFDYTNYDPKTYHFKFKSNENDHFRLQTQSLTAGLIYTF